MSTHDINHIAQLRSLTQTASGTPMGTLLRQFWHPIAIGGELETGKARSLRVLSEDLTLYRGESGKPYLIGGRCAHRCTVLHTGWVEQDHVRCMYHGWRYDGMGRCTEIPAEPNANTERVRIAGYPVVDYHGLLFAYLGDEPVPPFELPRNEGLEQPGVDVTAAEDVWDCNWMQQVENSLDATHLSFVHQWPEPTMLGSEIGAEIPKLIYEETTAGIRQTAIRGGSTRVSNWTFPNNNNVLGAPPRPGDPWQNTVFWAVPIDDCSTFRFTLKSYPGGEVGEQLRQNGALAGTHPIDYAAVLFGEHRLPDVNSADKIRAQDYVAVRGQGVIYDRAFERLGASDAGVALLRRIFLRELEVIRTGSKPKQWRRIEEPIELQTIGTSP